jgi:hypothetical protein
LGRISRWIDWIRNPASLVFLLVMAVAAALGFGLPLAALRPRAALDLLLAGAAFKAMRCYRGRGGGDYAALGLAAGISFLLCALAAMTAGKIIGLAVGFDPGAWWLAVIRQLVN